MITFFVIAAVLLVIGVTSKANIVKLIIGLFLAYLSIDLTQSDSTMSVIVGSPIGIVSMGLVITSFSK